MSFDLYAEITGRIMAELEQGCIPWHKTWVSAGAAISHATGKPYSMLNQFLLGRPGEYLTFRQAAEEGGFVRKGEKSRLVVFWKWIEETDQDTGEVTKHPWQRYYNVFHIDQCEGIKPRYDKLPMNPASPDAQAEAIADAYILRSGVKLRVLHSAHAYYTPSEDSVTVPEITQFTETAEYYSVLYHELTHSTGHASRLNRLHAGAAMGSDEYSAEELVAEMGAAFLVHTVGLETPSSFRNNSAYIQGWLKVLKNDKRLIVTAAGKAEKAVRMILGEEAVQHDDV